MRKPLIAGNWKMNKTIPEAVELASGILERTTEWDKVDVAVCPPATALAAVRDKVAGTHVVLGAQDIFIQPSGAFTGMISPGMLLDAGCQFVIVGHSERRGRFGTMEDWMRPEVLALFGDSDMTVNLKAKVALENGLTPIVCCGETSAERKAGQTDDIVRSQIKWAFEGFSTDQVKQCGIAYEPVWAIGTGDVCDATEANRVCGLIRETVASITDSATADSIRILYGGSVKPDNAGELMAKPNIDGGLVGGASLKVADFCGIISETAKQY